MIYTRCLEINLNLNKYVHMRWEPSSKASKLFSWRATCYKVHPSKSYYLLSSAVNKLFNIGVEDIEVCFEFVKDTSAVEIILFLLLWSVNVFWWADPKSELSICHIWWEHNGSSFRHTCHYWRFGQLLFRGLQYNFLTYFFFVCKSSFDASSATWHRVPNIQCVFIYSLQSSDECSETVRFHSVVRWAAHETRHQVNKISFWKRGAIKDMQKESKKAY